MVREEAVEWVRQCNTGYIIWLFMHVGYRALVWKCELENVFERTWKSNKENLVWPLLHNDISEIAY